MLYLREEFAEAWRDRDPFVEVEKLQGEVFRHVKARTTLRFEFQGRRYFLKIHRGIGWGEIFKDLLQLRSPILGARNEWQAIDELTALNIGTMTAAAYGSRGSNPARQHSFIITEALENTISLEDYCATWPDKRPAFAHKLALLRLVADISRRMHGAGICHRDYYLCHFLLHQQPDGSVDTGQPPQLSLIDLHRAIIDARLPQRWKIKDVAGLYFSAMDIGLTRTDLLRFVRIYTGLPLRQALQQPHWRSFWQKVDSRAHRLYARIHGDSRQRLHAGRTLAVPLMLPVRLQQGGQTQLELLQVFRVLPGKRVVALARYGRHTVVAKVFFEAQRWQSHLRREKQGIAALQAADIATAPIVAEGELLLHPGGRERAGGVLLLQYLADGQGLGEHWQQLTQPAQREQLLQSAVARLAWCHHQGLIQHDIHLDNFLLQKGQLFLLDAADVQPVDTATAKGSQACLDNLALFFAQFPVSNDVHLPALFSHYQTSSQALQGRYSLEMTPEEFLNLVAHWREKRWQLVSKKLSRDTTAHHCSKSWKRFVIHQRSLDGEQFRQFLADPDRTMQQGEMLKDGNSSTVVKLTLDAQAYVVKRYNIKSASHGLRRLFQPSRAWRSWHNAHMLQMFGLGTARPVAMIERRIGPLRRQAWFVAEAESGTDALHFLENTPINSAPWQTALLQFRTLFQTLRQYRIVHGDMKATNFISQPDRLVVLDLDAMHRQPSESRFRQAFRRDLLRFLANWQHRPEAARAVHNLLEDFITLPPGQATQADADSGSEGGLKS